MHLGLANRRNLTTKFENEQLSTLTTGDIAKGLFSWSHTTQDMWVGICASSCKKYDSRFRKKNKTKEVFHLSLIYNLLRRVF